MRNREFFQKNSCYVIFNNYGQWFRELLALYIKILVRLSVLCHFDAHVRTMLSVSAECRQNSRCSLWGALLPLRGQLEHVNSRFLQKVNDKRWKFKAANFRMEGGFNSLLKRTLYLTIFFYILQLFSLKGVLSITAWGEKNI